MSSKLHTIAAYDHESDSISMEVSLVDTATNILHPELVSSGTVQILYCNQKITEIIFDKYFGNADGTFKFTFAHPSARSGLTFDVGVTADDGTGFVAQGAVTHTIPDETTSQPTASTPTFPTVVPIRGPLKGVVIAACNENNILVEVSLLDPASNILHPEEVKTGTVQLLYTNVLLSEIPFDRNFGNSDGTFKFSITNPGITKGLFVRTNIFTVHPMVGTNSPLFLTGTGPVTPTLPSTIPLSSNATPDPNDYRGVERLVEDGSLSILPTQKPTNPDFQTRIIYPSSSAVVHIFRKTLKTTLTVTDSVSWSREYAFNDSVGSPDSMDRVVDSHRLPLDITLVTDSLYNEVDKEVNDSALVTDLLQEAIVYDKSLSDTASTTDLVQTEIFCADSVPIIDLTTTATDYHKSHTDTVTTTDRMFRELDNESTNTIFIDDELLTREAQWLRRSTDTVAVVDVGASVTSIESFYDDDLVIPTGSMGVSLSLSLEDTNAIAEVLSKAVNYRKTQTDTLVVTESVVKSVSYRKTITDTITASDLLSTARSYTKYVADTLIITGEDYTETSIYEVDFVESLPVTDSISRTETSPRSVSDTATISDHVYVTKSYAPYDTVTITDSIYVTKSYSPSDTTTITDSAIKATAYHRPTTDTTTITDSVVRNETLVRSNTDTATVVDTGSNVTSIESFYDDDLVIPDGSMGTSLDLALEDLNAGSDLLTEAVNYVRSQTDTTTVTDSVTYSRSSGRSATFLTIAMYSLLSLVKCFTLALSFACFFAAAIVVVSFRTISRDSLFIHPVPTTVVVLSSSLTQACT